MNQVSVLGLEATFPMMAGIYRFIGLYYYTHSSTSVTTSREAERLITLFATDNGDGDLPPFL